MTAILSTDGDQEWEVQKVASQLNPPVETATGSPVQFFHLLSLLKARPRSGWVQNKIPNPESIADHMYRMTLLALFAPPSLTSRLDIIRVAKMCLFHDIAETLVGDITPFDPITRSEKNRRESTTITFLCREVLANVPGLGSKELEDIWHEFEDGETDEARFAQDLDKLELLLQAVEYERMFDGDKDLSGFMRVHAKILLPEVKEWSNTVMAERKAMWEGWGKTPESDSQGLDLEAVRRIDNYYGK